jgi:mannose-6-phosphate isomerase-like protein (cupin superfamily)
MKHIENISEGENYTAISVGSLDKLVEHSIIHPISGQEIVGKVFIKDAIQATGTEVSFQILPPQTELGYFHTHKKNEEMYIVLKGKGEFQVDDSCFPIEEGCVVRIAPKGKRSLRNSSEEPMIYMVIQSKENSLEEFSTDDGERVAYKPKWK